MTTAVSAFVGSPCREVSEKARGPHPSREYANIRRLAPAAPPRALANALDVVPKLNTVARPEFANSFASTCRGAADPANCFAPAVVTPNPRVSANMDITYRIPVRTIAYIIARGI